MNILNFQISSYVNGHQSALFFYFIFLCGTSCQDLHWIRQLIDNVKIYHVFGEFSHGA